MMSTKAENAEMYRLYGELIGNIYRLKRTRLY